MLKIVINTVFLQVLATFYVTNRQTNPYKLHLRLRSVWRSTLGGLRDVSPGRGVIWWSSAGVTRIRQPASVLSSKPCVLPCFGNIYVRNRQKRCVFTGFGKILCYKSSETLCFYRFWQYFMLEIIRNAVFLQVLFAFYVRNHQKCCVFICFGNILC